MKRILFLLLSAVLFALAGCTKDLPSDNKVTAGADGDSDGDYVYMDIAMQLPVGTGTRSKTDWTDEGGPGYSNSDAIPDTEEGYDYENTVKTVLLVIAGEDDEYITHAEVTGIYKGSKNTYSIKAKFKGEDIEKAYEGPLAGESEEKTVKIYAYVNYTENLHNLFSNINKNGGRENNAWLHWSGTIEERPSKAGQTPAIDNTIWAKHSFLMTNAVEFLATFPITTDDWDKHRNEANPYNIVEQGAILVERAAARIDFKDASKDLQGRPNTYNLNIGTGGSNGAGLNLVDVQLTRMSLVNMSKNFYYLRRVSAGYGKDVKVGKNETMYNWVVDTDWDAKYKGEINPGNATDYFNFALYGAPHDDHFAYNRSGWYIDNIKEITEKDDNFDQWNTTSKGEYHIWRYVTENTIPTDDAQKTIQSTGIVFKGLILPGEDIKESAYEDNVNTRYVSEKVEKALIASSYHLPQKGDGTKNTSKNGVWDGESDLDEILDKIEDSSKVPSYDYPTIYEFDGLLYAGFAEVVDRAATEGNGSLLYAVVDQILKNWYLVPADNKFVYKAEPAENDIRLTIRAYNEIVNGKDHTSDGTDYSITLKDENGNVKKVYSIDLDESAEYFKALATSHTDSGASNLTIYEASYEDEETENGEGWGYYCYYFYWNRHNDNGLDGKMGQMEFAIVRNNVYKLSVSKINRLGHPRNPDNDPDPVDPNDPDEEDRVYLTVDIQVLPWVVRVNDITF